MLILKKMIDFFFSCKTGSGCCSLKYRHWAAGLLCLLFLVPSRGKSCTCSLKHSTPSLLEHYPSSISVTLNSLSLICLPLASIGLADMMSPGESKLPMALKADSKEEGTAPPESKAKVLPIQCHHILLSHLGSACLWCLLRAFLSVLIHLWSSLHPLCPSWCGPENDNSYCLGLLFW